MGLMGHTSYQEMQKEEVLVGKSEKLLKKIGITGKQIIYNKYMYM